MYYIEYEPTGLPVEWSLTYDRAKLECDYFNLEYGMHYRVCKQD